MTLKMGLDARKMIAEFEYDFSKHGGAIGAITMTGGKIPTGALIVDGKIYTETAPVGATATIALGLASANDIKTATAITSFTLGSIQDVIPVRTAATAVLLASAAGLTATIATAALTAGKFRVYLEYYLVN